MEMSLIDEMTDVEIQNHMASLNNVLHMSCSKVSERSERAFWKTRAMKCAERLQTATCNTELTSLFVWLTLFARPSLKMRPSLRSAQLKSLCGPILDKVLKSGYGHIFEFEVDAEEFADYSKIIKKPMCLDKISKKLDIEDYKSFEVSERSERAMMKTIILAMKCAKWLETLWLHPLTHPIRLACSFRSFRSSFIKNAPRFARRRISSLTCVWFSATQPSTTARGRSWTSGLAPSALSLSWRSPGSRMR